MRLVRTLKKSRRAPRKRVVSERFLVRLFKNLYNPKNILYCRRSIVTPRRQNMTNAKKIKFSITLTPECYEILTEFVEVTGNTKSGFISQVLEEQKGVLKELTKTVKKANKLTSEKVSLLDT